MATIPFNRPFVVGKELFYIAQAVTYNWLAGDGHFTKRCAALLQERFGIGKVLLTPSCTAALEMAALLLELGPGDEVIVPSFTFVSTANAFVLRGAKPVFVDLDPQTLNIDPAKIEAAITPRTRAIFPVHYAGVACDMDAIGAIAEKHGLAVVEDAAQGVNSWYKGRALGSIGTLGTYSFHETKNCICGEGGALCINDPKLIERAEIFRDKGTNRASFRRGEVDKYTWVDVGSSYVPSEITSAFLLAQLESLDTIATRRKAIHDRYIALLEPLAAAGHLRLPVIPEDCVSSYHMLYILLADFETREGLRLALRDEDIHAVFHYVPLHSSPMGKTFGYTAEDLPITEATSRRLLRLPMYYEISEAEQDRVVAAIRRYFS